MSIFDQARQAWRQSHSDRPVILLDSGRGGSRWARQCWLAQPVMWYCANLEGNNGISAKLSAFAHPGGSEPGPASDADTENHLSIKEDAEWGQVCEQLASELPSSTGGSLWDDLKFLTKNSKLPGKWFGYFSYELNRVIESESMPMDNSMSDRRWPLVIIGYDPKPRCFESEPGSAEGESHSNWGECGSFVAGRPKSVFGREAYEAAVQRVINYIAAGDVFQVNLAQRFSCSFEGTARALFEKLNAVSPAWYGACMELPDALSLVSTSPELFLEVKGREVITRPIKGTRPSDMDVSVLRDSVKDQAELNMIVDLMRNDLGRVCEYGSVRVPEPRVIESHPTIHHGVSTVTGRLREDCDLIDLLQATLPGGSVTGAPKVRAMQIIDELEPVLRGPYCGSMGYISGDEMCLNIAIRTICLDEAEGICDFSVGGGIVADSKPAAEYQETLDKAAAMMRALAL